MTQSILETSIDTKYGNAKITQRGYYQITSKKEGNNLKYLHRLIWEDFYGKPIPNGYIIHHLNGDKTDNRIQNLQCVDEKLHIKFHNTGKSNGMYNVRRCGKNATFYGKTHTENARKKISDANKGKKYNLKTRLKISKNRNTSGYFRVYKHKNPKYKQGFAWEYLYYENGKQKRITSNNLKKLEQKVKEKGLEWCKV